MLVETGVSWQPSTWKVNGYVLYLVNEEGNMALICSSLSSDQQGGRFRRHYLSLVSHNPNLLGGVNAHDSVHRSKPYLRVCYAMPRTSDKKSGYLLRWRLDRSRIFVDVAPTVHTSGPAQDGETPNCHSTW